MGAFVSRAGQKLEHALAVFAVDPAGRICADFGSNVGGFVDCLLQHGAAKVYAIDTGYGVLEWKLRKDPRVTAMERTNAMHVQPPEPVSLVTIDVAWTRQQHILPAAARCLAPAPAPAQSPAQSSVPGGEVITLIKPHYEAEPAVLRGGVLPEDQLEGVLERVRGDIDRCGFELVNLIPSPLRGAKGNTEYLAHLRRR